MLLAEELFNIIILPHYNASVGRVQHSECYAVKNTHVAQILKGYYSN